MKLSDLKAKIIESFIGLTQDLEQVLQMVEDDKSIFPFNEYEGQLHIKQDNMAHLSKYELIGDNLEQVIWDK